MKTSIFLVQTKEKYRIHISLQCALVLRQTFVLCLRCVVADFSSYRRLCDIVLALMLSWLQHPHTPVVGLRQDGSFVSALCVCPDRTAPSSTPERSRIQMLLIWETLCSEIPCLGSHFCPYPWLPKPQQAAARRFFPLVSVSWSVLDTFACC